jgi:hypothetical protein
MMNIWMLTTEKQGGEPIMIIALAQLYPRILRFWLVHILMALVGALTMYVGALLQRAGANFLGPVVTLALSLGATLLYFLFMKLTSRSLLKSRREGWAFAFGGIVPMILLIMAALYARSLTPYNTITYGLILVPVTLPFQGWIETVFPLLPMHILALSVPLVYMAGVVAGTAMKED